MSVILLKSHRARLRSALPITRAVLAAALVVISAPSTSLAQSDDTSNPSPTDVVATGDPCPPEPSTDSPCVLTGPAETFGVLQAPGTSNLYEVVSPGAGSQIDISLMNLPADYD